VLHPLPRANRLYPSLRSLLTAAFTLLSPLPPFTCTTSLKLEYEHLILALGIQLAIGCAGITCTHAFAWERELMEMPKCFAGILAQAFQKQAAVKNQPPFHPS